MSITFKPKVINQVLSTLKDDLKWSELAKRSDIDNSTLTAVRNGNRNFTPKIASKIANGLKLDSSVLYSMIAEFTIQLEKNKIADRDLHIGEEFVGFVVSKMESLTKGDFYINISSSPSIEFKSTEAPFVQQIIDAVGRGAIFYHIFPKRPKTDRLTDEQIRLYLIDNSLEVELKFNMWKKDLIRRYATLTSEIDNNIRSCILDLDDYPRYFAPFNRYILHVSMKTQEDGSLDRIASARCWQEILDTTTGENVYVELGESAKGAIFRMCSAIIPFKF